MNKETNGVRMFCAVFAAPTGARLSAAAAAADSDGRKHMPTFVSDITNQ
jgi:hypothetical protein